MFRTTHAIFFLVGSKLGVPIKTTISATVLEDALKGTVTIKPLPLGRPHSDKVSTWLESEKDAWVAAADVPTTATRFYLYISVNDYLTECLLQVEKQGAHFFGVTISEQQAESGIVIRVISPSQSKFKVVLMAGHSGACAGDCCFRTL